MSEPRLNPVFARALSDIPAEPASVLDSGVCAWLAALVVASYYEDHPERAHARGDAGQVRSLAAMGQHLEQLALALAEGAFPRFAEYMRWASFLLEWYGVDRSEQAEILRIAAEEAERRLVGELRDGVVESLIEAARLLPEMRLAPAELMRVAPHAQFQASFEDTPHALMTMRKELARLSTIVFYAREPRVALYHSERDTLARLVDAERMIEQLSHGLGADAVDGFADHLSWHQCFIDAEPGSGESGLAHVRALNEAVDMAFAPEHGRAVAAFVEASIERMDRIDGSDATSYIDESTDTGRLARHYLSLLLAGERREASQLILREVEAGLSIKRLYLEVFQVSQYEIGRLWQRNEISVAHEHFCTAATQMIMSQLYDRILATARCDKTLVATCVSDDLHEIGVRMVCDFFEMAGWDTYYLGSNTPIDAVLTSVRERQADVLAVSITLAAHLGHVEELIHTVRAAPDCGRVKIMVGGLPFVLDRELWRRVGADGHALDAEGAVEVGERLVAPQNPDEQPGE